MYPRKLEPYGHVSALKSHQESQTPELVRCTRPRKGVAPLPGPMKKRTLNTVVVMVPLTCRLISGGCDQGPRGREHLTLPEANSNTLSYPLFAWIWSYSFSMAFPWLPRLHILPLHLLEPGTWMKPVSLWLHNAEVFQARPPLSGPVLSSPDILLAALSASCVCLSDRLP